MKIASIVGARPQFIKVAPVSAALPEDYEEILIHTGQHYDQDLSDIFFSELGIREPDYNLGIGSGHHGWQTGKMLACIEEVLLEETPDLIIVYGDTNSTLAGALAACKLHILTAHVEAGLRSFNRRMPEEINRLLTDHVSGLLFCPTETAVENLANENIYKGVHLVGDVMYDALLYFMPLAEKRSSILKTLGIRQGKYYLATVHRAENTDDVERMQSVLECLIAADQTVVFPIHPRTELALKRFGFELPANVLAMKPVSYLDMLILQRHARAILTDSGGIQKEAYFLSVPCITLREETEWVETVDAGWNVLVGVDPSLTHRALNQSKPKGTPPKVFGDGKASKRIIKILEDGNTSKPKS